MSDLRTLPPWDANRWFFLPKESVVSLGVGAVAPLCLADPMRVGLILADPNRGQTLWMYGITNTVSATEGIGYPTNGMPMMITHHEWGPLCQMQWFGFAPTGNVNVTVIELTLRDWPQSDPDDNMDVRDYLAYIADFVKSASDQRANRRQYAS